jgi:hypothetical protein
VWRHKACQLIAVVLEAVLPPRLHVDGPRAAASHADWRTTERSTTSAVLTGNGDTAGG